MNLGNGHISIVEMEKRYFPHNVPAVEVLKGVNLTIHRGDTMAIVGASGVGKSTLLHVMGALDRPTGGHIYINGLDIFSLDDNKLAYFRNLKLGFVFQFHHLLTEFTALENTMMPGLIARMDKKLVAEKARHILERMGLGERVSHKPGELSGGEQQRVAVARALSLEPEIFLADEPTGNLDERTGEKLFTLLLELNEEKSITTVVVTHNRLLASLMKRRVTIVGGIIEELT